MRVSDIKRRVAEGNIIPKGYGLCYEDFDTREGIYFPVPFNLLIRFALVIYWAVVGGLFPLRIEKLQSDAYTKGRRDEKERYEKMFDSWLKQIEERIGRE